MSITATKRWVFAEAAPPALLRRFKGLSPIMAQVLYNRGFDDPDAAARFFYVRDVDTTAFNPFNLDDMPKAVARLRAAIRTGEKIVVYGDFDADGVTSTTLLVQALRALGADAAPYIPKRVDEGYGLNTPALQKLARDGVQVVVTVDCGIRSLQEVEEGKAAGLDIIISDHHSLGAELPNAYAVINCKREKYPEKMLAGVGVAYKIAHALTLAEAANVRGRRNGARPFTPDELLDLVAIGTVADLMPLNHLENRTLVRRGLRLINEGGRPGLRALLDVSGVKLGEVTATTIGFIIGPRINAAGRLDDAMIAYNLLAAPTYEDALPWAEKLQELNTQRQEITREAQDKIREKLDFTSDLSMIIAGDRSFQPGIVGLVAGRLVEEFSIPAVVMEEGDEESRASCRSIPGFDITAALDQCADLLVRHGGHALAAGFTVRNENIPALRHRLTGIASEALRDTPLEPVLEIDAVLDMPQISEGLISEIAMLEPTGHSNPRPIFSLHGARVMEARTVGRDERHLRLKLARPGQPPLDGIGFGLGAWANRLPECVDVAFELEMNEWNGRRSVQMKLQDVRPAQ